MIVIRHERPRIVLPLLLVASMSTSGAIGGTRQDAHATLRDVAPVLSAVARSALAHDAVSSRMGDVGNAGERSRKQVTAGDGLVDPFGLYGLFQLATAAMIACAAPVAVVVAIVKGFRQRSSSRGAIYRRAVYPTFLERFLDSFVELSRPVMSIYNGGASRSRDRDPHPNAQTGATEDAAASLQRKVEEHQQEMERSRRARMGGQA